MPAGSGGGPFWLLILTIGAMAIVIGGGTAIYGTTDKYGVYHPPNSLVGGGFIVAGVALIGLGFVLRRRVKAKPYRNELVDQMAERWNELSPPVDASKWASEHELSTQVVMAARFGICRLHFMENRVFAESPKNFRISPRKRVNDYSVNYGDITKIQVNKDSNGRFWLTIKYNTGGEHVWNRTDIQGFNLRDQAQADEISHLLSGILALNGKTSFSESSLLR